MEEAVPVLPQVVDEEAAEEVVSLSPTEAATEGVEPPIIKKKKRTVAPKKRDALPGVRRRAVKSDIIREPTPPPPIEVNADFYLQLGRSLHSLERESRQRRLAALEIV